MENLTNLVSFYRGHVQMSMYGFRCQLRDHFKILPGNEVAEKDKAVAEKLDQIDDIVTNCLQALEAEKIENEVKTIKDIDGIRERFEKLTKKYKDEIDAIMASDVVRTRLMELFLEQQKQEQIRAAKAAANPANITGSPAELKGAATATISKDGDVKPVEEKTEVPQNDAPAQTEQK